MGRVIGTRGRIHDDAVTRRSGVYSLNEMAEASMVAMWPASGGLYGLSSYDNLINGNRYIVPGPLASSAGLPVQRFVSFGSGGPFDFVENNWAATVDSNTRNFATGLARTTDGRVLTWGQNNTPLGRGNPANDMERPQEIGGEGNTQIWSSASIGYQYGLAVRASDNTLWAWGGGANGVKGGTANVYSGSRPEQQDANTDWVEVAACVNHSLAVRDPTTRNLLATGINSNGNTGQGTTTGTLTAFTPVLKSAGVPLTGVVSFSPGINHSLAVTSDGKLWAWGSNAGGRTGLSLTSGSTTYATQVGTDVNWSKCWAGFEGSYALKSTGQFYVWGVGTNASLPDRSGAATSTPSEVYISGSVTAVAPVYRGCWFIETHQGRATLKYCGLIGSPGVAPSFGSPGNTMVYGQVPVGSRLGGGMAAVYLY